MEKSFSEGMSPLSQERIKKIKETREQVVEELPEKQKTDKGEIRLRLSELLMEEDKTLPKERREEIAKRAINRHIRELNIGNPEIKGHIEALHAATPTTGEILKSMEKNFPGLPKSKIFQLNREFNQEIEALQEAHPELMTSEIINILIKEQKDERSQKLLYLKQRFDEATDKVAEEATRPYNISYLIPRRSRLLVDMNREILDRKITSKVTALEYGLGAKEVHWTVLNNLVSNACSINQQGEVESPYLNLTIHGKAREGTADVVVANGLKRGKMPCYPEVARWIKDKLEEKIKEKRIISKAGKLATVSVAQEADDFSGDKNLINYRYGDKTHKGFGELLQVVQLEIERDVRKRSSRELSKALAEIMQDFSREFKGKEQLEGYIEQHETEENRERKKGIIRLATATHPSIQLGSVGLSKGFRTILDLEIRDTVLIEGEEYEVSKAPKEFVGKKLVIFPEEGTFPQEVKVQKKR